MPFVVVATFCVQFACERTRRGEQQPRVGKESAGSADVVNDEEEIEEDRIRGRTRKK